MKRKIRQNIWANWNGYVGTRKVIEFGTDELAANIWIKGDVMLKITDVVRLSTVGIETVIKNGGTPPLDCGIIVGINEDLYEVNFSGVQWDFAEEDLDKF